MMNDDQANHNPLASEQPAEEMEGNQQTTEGQAGQDPKDQKIDELTQALARAMADLQNFKRRSEEEKVSFLKYANAELLKNILPFVDNLDRSVSHLPEELKENQWAKGVVHLHADLSKTLASMGVEKIKTVGEKLDPNLHEGLMSGPGEKDVIVEEFEPGYKLGETIIKVARVKVGDGS